MDYSVTNLILIIVIQHNPKWITELSAWQVLWGLNSQTNFLLMRGVGACYHMVRFAALPIVGQIDKGF